MSLIVKKSLSLLPKKLLPALLIVLGVASSCNKKEETPTESLAVTISTVAVKNFNLKADSKVLSKLDTVFFSIDLKNGVIFNADSLPKGTKINKLIPVITFLTDMSEATIVMEDGEAKKDTVNYLTNATDTIDFTKKVTLNVTAADGVNKYSYRIKVNVHEQVPDSMTWDKIAVSKLPSRLPDPVMQKSVALDDKVVSLIKENDNTLTLSTTASLYDANWQKQRLELPFEPDLQSLEATSSSLYMLADDGRLFASADGVTWTDTKEVWASIIGPYLDSMLGIKETGSGLRHCHYPASTLIADTDVDPDFPISGRSAFKTISSKWTPYPTGFFVGGVKPSGELSADTWGFDGTRRTVISNEGLSPVEGATLVKYVVYRATGKPFTDKAYDAWLLIGGKDSDSKYYRTPLVSHDNGVTWSAGSTLMQLPGFLPDLAYADGIVIATPLKADLADGWKKTRALGSGNWSELDYTTEGTEITWQCPYIYLIGGNTNAGILSDAIWRGVLARLEFTPII